MCLFIALTSNILFADEFEYNGVYYSTLSDGTAEVMQSVLGAYTFASVTIPDTAYETVVPAFGDPYLVKHAVTSIGADAFSNCSKLHSITLPKTLKYIQKGAFTNCRNLESVDLPEGLVRVNYDAFWRCASLKELIFPSTTDSIGVRNFGGMATDDDIPGSFFESQLRRVIIKASTPPHISGNLSEFFDETDKFSADSVDLYVHATTIDNYTSSSDYTSVFKHIYPYGNGNVNIMPTEKTDSVKISWFNFYGVEDYLVTVNKGETVIARFSVTKDGTSTRLLSPRRIEEENDSTKSSTEMFVVTLGSLEGSTTYTYNVSGTNKQKELIFRTAGSFSIDGTKGIKQDQEEIVRVVYHTISVAANDDMMGTVSGGGRIEGGLWITLTATPNEHYRFVQWSDGNTDNPRTVIVTKDDTYTAVFDEQIKYTVTFIGFDTKELKTEEVETGYAATAPETPAVEGYEFKGWDKDFSSVKSDLTVKAQYEIKNYKVTINAAHGEVSVSQDIDLGAVPWGTELELTAAADKGYRFVKWSDASTDNPRNIVVKEDVTITAQFEEDLYMVTFIGFGGATIKFEYILAGESAQAPDLAEVHGWHFVKWDTDFSNVTSNITVTAIYEINTYTVVFVDWDGTELSRQTVEHGSDAVAPQDPAREGYTFTGWSNSIKDISSDLTVIAQYKENPATGTEKTSAPVTAKPGKVLRGGVMYILRGGRIYCVDGAVVQ